MIVPFCAALCAAVTAHVAIDVAGDYLLPHDTFDDAAHGSRLLFGSFAALLAMTIFGAAVRGAIREARGREAAFCDALRELAPGDLRWYFAAVVGFTFALLLAMQSIDGAVAGGDADDLAGLFGGSIFLGGTCTLAAALVAAVASRWLYVRLGCFRRTFVALTFAFVDRSSARETAVCRISRAPVRRYAAAVFIAANRCAGRAPPRLLKAR
jgi:hypothetical protein